MENINNTVLVALNPFFVTGFSDGEGCFSINLTKNQKYKTGFNVALFFSIGLDVKDKVILERIKIFFGPQVGHISKQGARSLQFRVHSIKDLKIIIDHFDEHPLITKKFKDYQLFKLAFELISQKEHLTLEGLRRLFAIKASMHQSVAVNDLRIKTAFPDTMPHKEAVVLPPVVKNKMIEHPE